MSLNAETKQKTPQHCSLCRNHGISQLKRGHKKECPFDNPEHMKTCDKNCPATIERREKVAAEKKEFDHLARDKTAPPVTKTGQRSPNRCRNCQFHGELGLRKDRLEKFVHSKTVDANFVARLNNDETLSQKIWSFSAESKLPWNTSLKVPNPPTTFPAISTRQTLESIHSMRSLIGSLISTKWQQQRCKCSSTIILKWPLQLEKPLSKLKYLKTKILFLTFWLLAARVPWRPQSKRISHTIWMNGWSSWICDYLLLKVLISPQVSKLSRERNEKKCWWRKKRDLLIVMSNFFREGIFSNYFFKLLLI